MPPDPLSAELLRAALTTLPARDIHFFERIDSTQRAALTAAAAPGSDAAPEGSVWIADSQSQGHGRHGHRWESPAGAGIYCSLVLRPQLPPSQLLPLTLAAGLAVADAVEAVAAPVHQGLQIRWPNDLLLDGKKFCGLLIEMSSDAARVNYAVLGVGINVHAVNFPPELDATALAAHTPRPLARAPLLAAVLDAFDRRYRDFTRHGPAPTLAEFERRSHYARGLDVRVGSSGDAPYQGRTDGLDPNGFLRVRLPSGELRLVSSGDVRPLFAHD